MRHTPLQQCGFSLIELLITMSIAVILLTIGVPSFVDFINSNKATGYANDLLGDLNYARSEAIARGLHVTVCHSAGGASCSGTWSDGWIVLVNSDTTVTATTVSNVQDILRVHPAINPHPNAVSGSDPGWNLSANNTITDFISFLPDGRSSQIGTFIFCMDNILNSGNQPRSSAMIVNQTGRIRVLSYNTSGIPLDENGTPLTTCTP